LHPPVVSFLSGPNILLRNLFSNTLSLCFMRLDTWCYTNLKLQ
jgi:hypothetical protein